MTFSANQILTAAELNDLPFGIESAVTSTSDVALSTSPATVTSVTFTTVSGKKYLALASVILDNVSNYNIVQGFIVQGATTVAQIQQLCDSTYDRQNMTMFGVFTGTGASETISHKMATSNGTATAEGTTFPSQLAVYDMGD